MKKTLKTKLLIAGGIAAALGAAVLAAPFFVPWDKVKDQVVAQASKTLGRKLSIGAIEASLFSGVKVKDIRLENAGEGFSKEPLFSNAEAKLSVSLLSIFTGKLVVNSISFVQPQILVETSAEGVSNLKGLGSSKAKAEKAEDGKGESFPVVIASLQIKDGQIVIRDKQKKSETAVKGIDLKLYGLSLAAAGGSRLELKLDAEVEGKKIPLAVTSNFKLNLAEDSLDIRSLEATLPALALSGKMLVEKMSKAPVVDGGVQLELKLADLNKLLPPSQLKKIPGELKCAGTVQLNVQAKGATADLKAMDLKAQLAFKGVDLAYGEMPGLGGLEGTLSVDKAGADLPSLAFKLDGKPAVLALKARWGSLDQLQAGAVNADISLKADVLNIEPLLAIALAEDTPEDIARKAREAKDLSVPDMRKSVPAGLVLNSLIEVGSLQAKDLKTGALKQQLQLKGRKLQSATDLGLYEGQFWERLNVDFNVPGPVWKGQAGLSKLDFAPFIQAMASILPESGAVKELNGRLSGSMGFKADLKGKGFTRGLRFRNLQADGSFFMKDGLMKQLSYTEKLAAVIPHPQTQAVLRSDIQFSNAAGDFEQGGGAFTLKRFTLGSGEDWRGGDLLLQATGVAVNGGKLDFKVIPRFNPARVQLDGAVGDAFKDKAGWPSYDYIAYYGPTAKEAKADFKSGLQNAAKQVVQKQVDKKVEEVKQKANDAVQDAIKDKAGDALKGLFGR